MNNQKFFDFEKEYQGVLNKVYDSIGYDIERIKGEANREYDAILTGRKTNKQTTIEEKGCQYYHKDNPIELIQDIKSCSLGWYYTTKAQYIWHIYYQEDSPYKLFTFSLHKLRESLVQYFEDKVVTMRLALGGYGITVNMCISWEYLIFKDIARDHTSFLNVLERKREVVQTF